MLLLSCRLGSSNNGQVASSIYSASTARVNSINLWCANMTSNICRRVKAPVFLVGSPPYCALCLPSTAGCRLSLGLFPDCCGQLREARQKRMEQAERTRSASAIGMNNKPFKISGMLTPSMAAICLLACKSVSHRRVAGGRWCGPRIVLVVIWGFAL